MFDILSPTHANSLTPAYHGAYDERHSEIPYLIGASLLYRDADIWYGKGYLYYKPRFDYRWSYKLVGRFAVGILLKHISSQVNFKD